MPCAGHAVWGGGCAGHAVCGAGVCGACGVWGLAVAVCTRGHLPDSGWAKIIADAPRLAASPGSSISGEQHPLGSSIFSEKHLWGAASPGSSIFWGAAASPRQRACAPILPVAQNVDGVEQLPVNVHAHGWTGAAAAAHDSRPSGTSFCSRCFAAAAATPTRVRAALIFAHLPGARCLLPWLASDLCPPQPLHALATNPNP
eukprot:361084-Chlamydomonas_euryale.AAC.3